MAFSNSLIKFANGDTTFYEAARDNYFNPTAEKAELLNKAFFVEIERQSGVAREGLSLGAWTSNPQVTWASFAIVDAVINTIIPTVLTDAIGVVSDIRNIGAGDMVKFRVRPNSFYTVSLGGRGERTTFRQKSYDGDVTLAPIEHIITVYVDMYSVLAGKEDIASFIRMAVLSILQEMYGDALSTMTAGLSALSAGTYNYTGAFDMQTLVNMAENVEVYNGGARPIIMGSASALMNVLPDATLGYRGTYDANGGAIDLFRNVYGFDVVRLNQAAAKGGSGLVLPTNAIYVVSPGADKLVKGVVVGDMSNSNQFYDNADITQNYTQRSGWNFVFATAAKAGIYTISA